MVEWMILTIVYCTTVITNNHVSSCILNTQYLVEFVAFNLRSRSNSSVRKTSQGGNRRDERTAALRAVRDLAGSGSRTQSPVRSGGSSRNSPVSGTQTPVEPSVSPNPTPAVDEKTMRKKTKSTIEEFFSVQDLKVSCLFSFSLLLSISL